MDASSWWFCFFKSCSPEWGFAWSTHNPCFGQRGHWFEAISGERSCTQFVRNPGNIPVDATVGGDEVEGEEINLECSSAEFGSFLAVESLNVSVAAGVLLHHLIENNDENLCIGHTSTVILEWLSVDVLHNTSSWISVTEISCFLGPS